MESSSLILLCAVRRATGLREPHDLLSAKGQNPDDVKRAQSFKRRRTSNSHSSEIYCDEDDLGVSDGKDGILGAKREVQTPSPHLPNRLQSIPRQQENVLGNSPNTSTTGRPSSTAVSLTSRSAFAPVNTLGGIANKRCGDNPSEQIKSCDHEEYWDSRRREREKFMSWKRTRMLSQNKPYRSDRSKLDASPKAGATPCWARHTDEHPFDAIVNEGSRPRQEAVFLSPVSTRTIARDVEEHDLAQEQAATPPQLKVKAPDAPRLELSFAKVSKTLDQASRGSKRRASQKDTQGEFARKNNRGSSKTRRRKKARRRRSSEFNCRVRGKRLAIGAGDKETLDTRERSPTPHGCVGGHVTAHRPVKERCRSLKEMSYMSLEELLQDPLAKWRMRQAGKDEAVEGSTLTLRDVVTRFALLGTAAFP